MSNISFIVDGHMEQSFVQEACKGKTVLRLNCNGKDAALEAIADRIDALVRAAQLHDFCETIFVIIDRENRSESAETLICNLSQLLDDRGHDLARFVLGIADRMIENWILADFKLIDEVNAAFRATHQLNGPTDGLHGKGLLKTLYRELGGYEPTQHGVKLLKKMCVKRAARKNNSLKAFLKLASSRIDCWWLKRR